MSSNQFERFPFTSLSDSTRTWSYSLKATRNMMDVTFSKQWIHFLRSDRCPPTSTILRRKEECISGHVLFYYIYTSYDLRIFEHHLGVIKGYFIITFVLALLFVMKHLVAQLNCGRHCVLTERIYNQSQIKSSSLAGHHQYYTQESQNHFSYEIRCFSKITWQLTLY